jgi:hypothetical protein
MFELTIKETVYPLNFGMGFLREINKKVVTPVQGNTNITQNIGLQFNVARLIDGDLEALVDVIDLANKGQTPRVTRAALDAHIEDEETDIDGLFEAVKDFLSRANATKKTTLEVIEQVAKELAKTNQ